MTLALPPLPDRALLADLCREVAATERVQPQLVEKDFYLTRLLWAFGDHFGNGLLLKGGTLLSKVELGFFRMSEDADLVLPGTPGRTRLSNVKRTRLVGDALKDLAPAIGFSIRFPAGELFEKGAHGLWQLEYASEFGPQGIKVEAVIHPALLPPRRVKLGQLLADPLAGDYRKATCWALDAAEARAEKVRAAFTRTAIRDFYDLDRFLEKRADFTSDSFVALVDAKLAELDAEPLAKQGPSFAMNSRRRRELDAAVARELRGVLRADAPAFDLERVFARFDRLWKK